MSDDKPKTDPVDDLKQGLGLLFRAAKGAVEKLPTDKAEEVAKDAAKEVARAFESLGQEVEKVIHPNKKPSSQPPPQDQQQSQQQQQPQTPPAPEKPFDDAYAPDPPKKP